jgi:hypothetical protein
MQLPRRQHFNQLVAAVAAGRRLIFMLVVTLLSS